MVCAHGNAQQKQTLPIPLPLNISEATEEFSGMAMWERRLYLLPQYGDHKKALMHDDFFMYSITMDSIDMVIDGKLKALKHYKKIGVNNLDDLPAYIKECYEGFEAIAIINGTVYLSIETVDNYDYCYLLKGKLDTVKNSITIDMEKIVSLKRQFEFSNAGFESLTYLPSENKLLALYEPNFTENGYEPKGYLIDTGFNQAPELINVPPVYFRITDISVTDKIYALNYYWTGDFSIYAKGMEASIKKSIPELASKLDNDKDYLKKTGNDYARIISLSNIHDTQWKQVVSFDCNKNNWEGLVIYRKGALVVSDANRNPAHQVTTLAYVPFE